MGQAPFDMFTQTMNDYHNARQIKHPDTGPASAGGYNKTSKSDFFLVSYEASPIVQRILTSVLPSDWDLEIRKRYAQPLFSETNEFPDKETIEARMLPICYEEGLPSGCAPGAAEFMNIATETYIKEALSNFFGRVSSNGDAYIKTASYKRQLEKEEEKCLRNEIRKNDGGLLPVEVEAASRRPALSMADLKLALELGDGYLGQVPLIAGQIINGGHLDVEFEGREVGDEVARVPDRVGKVNGINGLGAANGIAYHVDADVMAIDEADWGWHGGGVMDLEMLNGVLDQCLSVGL